MVNETNNMVRFTGVVDSELTYSHEIFSESFYTFKLKVLRLSGQSDSLPVIISERLLAQEYGVGCRITVEGQLRSYNMLRDGRSHLVLQIFVKNIGPAEEGLPDENTVYLQGFVCKTPIYRTTPFCREIADILLAVNRAYGKSDYIPCICWGRNARFCREIVVSQFLSISGRLQSRNYEKHLEDGSVQERTAYEVSVSKLSLQKEEDEAF